jgi:hypothetical protein
LAEINQKSAQLTATQLSTASPLSSEVVSDDSNTPKKKPKTREKAPMASEVRCIARCDPRSGVLMSGAVLVSNANELAYSLKFRGCWRIMIGWEIKGWPAVSPLFFR